jgi:hypothetical protein
MGSVLKTIKDKEIKRAGNNPPIASGKKCVIDSISARISKASHTGVMCLFSIGYLWFSL